MLTFGLYETLRIVLPGGMAVATFDVTLRLIARLATSPNAAVALRIANSLDASTFALASLGTGLLLYAIDAPKHLRVFLEGDPASSITRPSDHLKKLWNGKLHEDKALSAYFLLTDSHLPSETHRRVYAFGGQYHIYANARFISSAGVALGGAALVAASGESVGTSLHGESSAVLVLVGLAMVGFAGELSHLSSARSSGQTDYRATTMTRLRLVAGPAIVTLILGTLAQFAGPSPLEWCSSGL